MKNSNGTLIVIFAILVALAAFMSIKYTLFFLDACVVVGTVVILGLVGFWMDHQVDQGGRKDNRSGY